jgi:hypothetical protein
MPAIFALLLLPVFHLTFLLLTAGFERYREADQLVDTMDRNHPLFICFGNEAEQSALDGCLRCRATETDFELPD